MDQDRRAGADRPSPGGPVNPSWAAAPPPSALAQSSLFAAPSPFSRAGSPTPSPAPVTPSVLAAPTPYGENPDAAPAYTPTPYLGPAPYSGHVPYGYAPVQNQKALLALIFGIAGFVLVSAIVGGFVGVAGMVLGWRARREIDADPQRHTGRAMATAGFWLGLVGVVGSLIYTVGLIFLLVSAPNSGF